MTTIALAAGAISAVSLLVVLSLMREIVILRVEIANLPESVSPAPHRESLGLPLPESVRRAIATQNAVPDRRLLIAAGARCPGCEHLANQIAEAVDSGEIISTQVMVVIDHDEESPAISALRQRDVAVIEDAESVLMKELQVVVTPTLFLIVGADSTVADYQQGGSLQWMLHRLAHSLTHEVETSGA